MERKCQRVTTASRFLKLSSEVDEDDDCRIFDISAINSELRKW